MRPTKRILIGVCTLVILAGFITYIVVTSFSSTVMVKRSPDKAHKAKLIRVDGFDTIFEVRVDGKRVYKSPDFAPVPTDFRELLAWDKSSQIVVLLIADERIFGYHAAQKRPLTGPELLKVDFTPFLDLGYEGVLLR